MIILKLQAGLGNQMFQYAYARARSLRSTKAYGMDIEMRMNLDWFNNEAARDTRRFYGLSHFNVKELIISRDEVCRIRGFRETRGYRLLEKAARKFRRSVLGLSDYVYQPSAARPVRNACIEGYWWNTEKYFADAEEIIRREFTPKEPLGAAAKEAEAEIRQSIQDGYVLVIIQVRRGDYATNVHANAFHGLVGTEFYDEAAKRILGEIDGGQRNKVRFCIVSDDIDWSMRNVRPKDLQGKAAETHAISRPGIEDYEEIYLMSLCHHFIISNSTFGWWGAWLSEGKDKVVVGPKRWVADPKVDTRDVLPESWIRI